MSTVVCSWPDGDVPCTMDVDFNTTTLPWHVLQTGLEASNGNRLQLKP